ncbi:MAG: ABC transporter ATP-binding protein [Acidobacteria bacterium]|nr:ABC transporter ATP-binding protein [Acidobacteriota bacterium]
MITLHEITKRYGKTLALDKLDLQIKEGEFFGFLGPNGAGKTTTIKIITGLLEADSGEVIINSLNIRKNTNDIKKLIGFIPDNPYLYEKLTANEYLRFIGRIFDMSADDIRERSRYLLNLFGLEKWQNELIESFSHGMRQKTVMASALLHRPKIIIVDEPMVGLDPKGIKLVKEIFSELAANEGVTIFMSTHTLSIAQEICTHIGIINKGKLIAHGTAKELQETANSSQTDLEEIFMLLTEEVSSTELALKGVLN